VGGKGEGKKNLETRRLSFFANEWDFLFLAIFRLAGALFQIYYITQKWERKKKEKENNPTSYDLNKMQLRMMERKEAFGMLWGESLGYKNTFHHQSRDMREEEDSVS
jgi:hypothetical protein